MAPPPLIKPRAARLERSAGDARPLSAISPRKVPRLHTARAAPPGASYREMTYNLHNLPWGDEVGASGDCLPSARQAGAQTDRSWRLGPGLGGRLKSQDGVLVASQILAGTAPTRAGRREQAGLGRESLTASGGELYRHMQAGAGDPSRIWADFSSKPLVQAYSPMKPWSPTSGTSESETAYSQLEELPCLIFQLQVSNSGGGLEAKA